MQTQKTITLKIPKPHKGRKMGGQARIVSELKRFNILCCGRRFGKTDIGEILIHKPLLQGHPVGWFAPTYKILNEAWDEIKRIYAPVIEHSNNTDKTIRFITGGVLEGWTTVKEGAGRSRKYKRVVIDEAARVPNLYDLFAFDIRPTLLDLQGDAFIFSTPKGLNDFYKLWQMAEDNPEWARWKMPTTENPHISLTEITAMKKGMPARVIQQELEAEFLEDGAFFQGLDAVCIIQEADRCENHKGHYITSGLDWALSDDFSVLRIYCVTCKKMVDKWRANKMDFSVQRMAIRDKLNYWNAPVLPERNSIGEPNIEILKMDGIVVLAGPDGKPGFNTTASTKPELIQKLAVNIERGSCRLFEEDIDELRSYEVQFTSGGHPKFSAPDGMNDDRVIADALAIWAADTGQLSWQNTEKLGKVKNYKKKWE